MNDKEEMQALKKEAESVMLKMLSEHLTKYDTDNTILLDILQAIFDGGDREKLIKILKGVNIFEQYGHDIAVLTRSIIDSIMMQLELHQDREEKAKNTLNNLKQKIKEKNDE